MFISNRALSKLYGCSAVFFFGAAVFAITSNRVFLAVVCLLAGAALVEAEKSMRHIAEENPGTSDRPEVGPAIEDDRTERKE